MIILDYETKKHNQIIHACTLALRAGKVVVYPTETSYGLGCDATNLAALRRLYLLKGRGFNRPIHVVIPSRQFAKKVGQWNAAAEKLAQAFWPGPLSIVLPFRPPSPQAYLLKLAAGTRTIGLRLPDHPIPLDLAKSLGRPIPATSANRAGQPDSYSLKDVLGYFGNQPHKPDIIINTGRLPKRQPSTLVRIDGSAETILRAGPITEKQIKNVLNQK